MVQLRSKDLGDGAYLDLARALSADCRAHGVPFVVNDRVDIAAIIAADGLHLGQEDLAIADARVLVGPMSIGASSHDLAQAEAAARAGADLIAFGPVFATGTKVDAEPVVGMAGLVQAIRAVAQPLIAIGGMTVERAAAAAQAGATYVAAIGALCGADDPEGAARAMHRAAGGRR